MIKKVIKYEDFDGNPREETFYFNLTKAEVTQIEMGHVGNGTRLSQYITQITEAKNESELIKLFQELILLSYGQKSADGRQFVKNEQMKEEFKSTQAFSELFTELSTDAVAAAAFINGILPKMPAQTPN